MNNFLRKRRQELGLTMLNVADKVGVTEATISRWENGQIANMRRHHIYKLAQTLNIDPTLLLKNDFADSDSTSSYLMYENVFPITTKKIPLLGEIACGEPIFANEEHEYSVEASADIQADFALKAKGDSMINARINDGDIVFIRKQSDVDNGEIAAVIIDDEATLKRVYKSAAGVTLVAENPKYEPLIYTEKDGVSINILGKAVAFQSVLQ